MTVQSKEIHRSSISHSIYLTKWNTGVSEKQFTCSLKVTNWIEQSYPLLLFGLFDRFWSASLLACPFSCLPLVLSRAFFVCSDPPFFFPPLLPPLLPPRPAAAMGIGWADTPRNECNALLLMLKWELLKEETWWKKMRFRLTFKICQFWFTNAMLDFE